MKDCIFCKIIRGEIPALKVYEDSRTLVFMDVAGDVDGHMLAVPKAHAESILDCEPEALADLTRTVQRVSRHLVHDCGYEGVNLLNASGTCAGQSVPHLHMHIIPRKRDDDIDAWPKLSGAKESIEGVCRRVTMLRSKPAAVPELCIRPAAAGDYEACAALEKEIFLLHHAQRPDMFRWRDVPLTRERFEALLGEDVTFFVAERGGRIVGHSFAFVRGYDGHPGFNDMQWLLIDDIVVDAESRGQGVGKALFAAMKEEARRRGLAKIELSVWGFNDSARRFYEDLGMRTRIQTMEYPVEP